MTTAGCLETIIVRNLVTLQFHINDPSPPLPPHPPNPHPSPNSDKKANFVKKILCIRKASILLVISMSGKKYQKSFKALRWGFQRIMIFNSLGVFPN